MKCNIKGTWNPKQPFINGCFNWMIPNLYIGNGCFTKHLFINGCLGFQEYNPTFFQSIAHKESAVVKTWLFLKDPTDPVICWIFVWIPRVHFFIVKICFCWDEWVAKFLVFRFGISKNPKWRSEDDLRVIRGDNLTSEHLQPFNAQKYFVLSLNVGDIWGGWAL